MALYHKWEAFVCFACNTMLAYSKRPGKETNFNVTKFAVMLTSSRQIKEIDCE